MCDLVDQNSIKGIVEEILLINSSDREIEQEAPRKGFSYIPSPIRLYIDSGGGDVYSYLGLIAVMRNSVTPVHTYVMGAAMSAAFMIAAMGQKRFCYKESTYMYHQTSTQSCGTLEDVKNDMEHLHELEKRCNTILFKRTNLSARVVRPYHVKNKDWYMTSSEALGWGVVDHII